MNKQDRRAVRLQASIIRGQIECLTSAAKHSPTEYERIMSSVRVLESVARVIDVFVPDEAKAASQPLQEGGRKYGANNTINTGEDGTLPALS